MSQSCKRKKTRRLKALSLFANIGIGEAYLRSIGVDVVAANEFVEKRAELYQRIYPESRMVSGDITKEETCARILEAIGKQKIDVLMATPPCQGMSTAGKQKEFDPRNDLFLDALKFVKKLIPDYVFFENVPAFMTTRVIYDGIPQLIPDVIRKEIGDRYVLNFYTENTQDYGVPQMRERVIMLGTRKALPNSWTMPKKDAKKMTLKDAIGWIPIIDPFVRDLPADEFHRRFPHYEEREKEALAISHWNAPTSHVWRNVVVMQHTPTGKSAFQNEDKWLPRKRNGEVVRGFKNTYKRQNWNTPGYTIAMDNIEISSQNNVHPGRLDGTDENGEPIYSDARAMTTFELMCMMSLPHDWPVPEDTDPKLLRKLIGEGVPSMFVKRIFENIPR